MRKQSSCRLALLPVGLLAIACLTLVLPHGQALSATVSVSQSGDDGQIDTCTLRQAIESINIASTNGNNCDVMGDFGVDDTVLIPEIVSSPIILSDHSDSQLTVEVPMVIEGPGRSAMTIMRSDESQSTFRVFNIDADSATLRGLSISGGAVDSSEGGGCILSNGELVLQRVRVEDCQASVTSSGGGGAIRANGSLTIIESGINHNQCSSKFNGTQDMCSGGGVAVTGTLTLEQSVLGGNVADIGGALAITEATGSDASTISGALLHSNTARSAGGAIHWGIRSAGYLINSTLSDNLAEPNDFSFGGGVQLANQNAATTPVLHILNSTITRNEASVGGGGLTTIGTDPVDLHLVSSVVTENTAPDNGDVFVNGEISGSHNLVSVSGSTLPPDTLNCDPDLGPLANNGGATMTHALAQDSCAVDAGSNPQELEFDQRGQPYGRQMGQETDIGAFELELLFQDRFEN
ncbi:choice-of-anchor Q domain-containing protein [Wenzhouxiangella sp. EGI_FJ10409]|uniref:choice-of-anchor Q domain-containing protein n=1 Tax=Wenzhouxiangella sp. EGI_FJ10409 TaxID=3243767 RepID=UPI0035D82474